MRMLDAALVPAAPVWTTSESDLVTIRLDLKTMTPVFGGGHTAREVDTVQAVRPSAIRGQLRYWWRATAGARFKTTAELYAAEAAIFGSTDKQGLVKVRIPRINSVVKKNYEERWRGTPNATRGPEERVFVFPFQRNQQQPAADFIEAIDFQVEVSTPSTYVLDIKNALRAWLVFGGIGSRTRRGCGALMVTVPSQRQDFLPPSPKAADGAHTRQWLEKLVFASAGGPDWTKLDGAGVICDNPDPYKPEVVNDIWRDLGTFWSRVRKNHLGKNEYKPVGKTLWPDHRRLSEVRGREATLVLGKAYLGLPIIYQQGRGFKGQVTPDKAIYGGERAASPVILKPLMYADGTVSAMVAVLRTPIVKLRHLKAGESLSITVAPNVQGDSHPLNTVVTAADKANPDGILLGNVLRVRGNRKND